MKRIITISLFILLFVSAHARQPQRGYRGFFDWANSLNSEPGFFDQKTTAYYTGISTSHGYQFNPYLFVGAGLSVENCRKFDDYIVPVFVEGRSDLRFGKFTPFGDLRLGYNMTNGGGVYFSPSVGYRFNWGRKVGINLSVGMALNGYKIDMYDIAISDDGYYTAIYAGSCHRNKVRFSFRIGFDF